VLLGSGAYLDRSWTWGAGWVVASLVGVGVPFVVGAGVIGGRSRALRRELADAAEGAVTAPLARIAREHVAGFASWTNTGLAFGIVFVMTTKPALAGSLAALIVAAGLGAVVALRLRWIGSRRV
jgi:protein-disulfide isomerase-like protein with CxxC motif